MPDQITSNTLELIDEFENETRRTELRVVEWIINNDKIYRLLEKREFFKKDNEWRLGKAKGFSIDDLGKIQAKWDDILDAMAGKKPEKEKKPF